MEEPLLLREKELLDEECLEKTSTKPNNNGRRVSERHFWSMVVAVLLMINLFLLHQWRESLRSSQQCVRPKLSYSAAKSAISYEKKTLFRDIQRNPLTGPPRDEFDQAWHDLMQNMVIKITPEELELLGEPSIAMKDGSGYIAEMAVYHELHCVKRIRHHLYLDHYYPNLTVDERQREDQHIDHCLEYWREAAMCRGDTTLAGFYWKQGTPTSTQQSTHECVNWDPIRSWAEERRVDLGDYSLLVE